ncbi:uncharacterized protein T551_00591 [Pneumocystis jirovecii RU7]|uniref:RNA helicase n=1 Tax=Pneumocystis jirovecii (strain RU7) TaxID=1408657 RepID=A0A0W4ZVU7_PNEJ7|nr:uncharacterized protein T551_00591 [Pneumocystis jirovecii RU7]KTW32501.1 hypothetical protein T551_00591 [Pneumocystis jirovecii RU7]
MDELQKLEKLNLISIIARELVNHVGIDDNDLVEFIIHLHSISSSLDDFKTKLEEAGADFTSSFIENIDRLILLMQPKSIKKKEGNTVSAENHNSTNDNDMKSQIFKGLSIPDKEIDWYQIPELSNDENNKEKYISTNKKRCILSEDKDPAIKSSNKNKDFMYEDNYQNKKYKKISKDMPTNNNHQKLSDKPELYKIYNGKVSGIKDFGIFVTLDGLYKKVDGLVHISAMKKEHINHPSDIVSKFQNVMVKVIKIDQNGRISLSMKDVDQSTGKDLNPSLSEKSVNPRDFLKMSSDFPKNYQNIPVIEEGDLNYPMKPRKRLNSYERWEIKQLMASGAVSASDYPELDDDYNLHINGNDDSEDNEDIDIEVRDEEPPFLIGQTKRSLQLSPIKIIKAPNGSMNRAAMQGGQLAKDRKELRQQEREAVNREEEFQDLSAQWLDPMAHGEKTFAQDLKNTILNKKTNDIPDWKKATFSKNISFGKITNLSITEQRQALPVFKLRASFVEAVHKNQLIIVVGDTGSGKTTQITQYLAEEGFANSGKIGCTQPRRVAAMSVAKRVAEEVGCRLGQEVGYTIRFEDCTSPETKIKYMTDGMLQRECLVDPDLKSYSVIILDEAHERTIATDVLFGLLKKSLKRRPDLKLIVTSATLDAEKFSSYFYNCPIFTIPGRTYPVEILYTKEPEKDYLDAALITVMQIHLSEPPGDILLFLTGQEEIDTSCEILFKRIKALGSSVPELIILPVYSALPSEIQSRIFEPAPSGSRKVVIATNIAETSITIDGIYYVVDPGFVKLNSYDSKLGMDNLIITPISQAQARQRAGRAGRTGPGKCYRLYTESAYHNEMLPNSIPEIQRQNLAHTIIMLKAMGINDLLHFDFMDPPPIQSMLSALEQLYALGALDNEGLLTRLGRKMADFPMKPSLAKVLITSVEMNCSEEMLSIVAMLSVQTVFYRPKDKQQQADQKKAKFHQPEGDHLTLLAVYNAWKSNSFSNAWCYENFIQARSMKKAQDVRQQLLSIFQRYNYNVVSCGKNYDRVRRALISGFFSHASKKDPHEGYKTIVEGTPVYIHPSSAIFGKPAEWVIYHELIATTKEYMHCVTSIEPKWLVEEAPSFFKIADQNKISKSKQREKIEPLYNRFATDQDEWRISKQKRIAHTSSTFG